MSEIFGKRLGQLLSNGKVTQKELSRKSGVSQSSICQYISGARNPSLEAAISIAAALDVPIELLLDEDGAFNGSVQCVEDAVALICAAPGALSSEQRKRVLKALIEL